MAETTLACPEFEPEPESGPGGIGYTGGRDRHSATDGTFTSRDRDPDTDGWLGDFRRGPAVFALFRIGPNNGGHPHLLPEYRIECNDGAGPRLICRFTDEPEAAPEWFGAWKNDEWCEWILRQSYLLIAKPDNS